MSTPQTRVTARYAWLILLLVACGGEVERARDASIAKAKLFAAAAKNTASPVSATRTGALSPVPDSVLYIDASRSMAGFAGCNQRATEYDVILDRILTELGMSGVIRFGERVRGSGQVFETQTLSRSIHCDGFYDRLENPDYELYRQFNEDSSRGVHVYVTDGVQSDYGGGNQSPSVNELQKWLEGGKALAILAFTSKFSGEAWSEFRQHMLGSVTVDSRPFYVLLFAPTEAALDSELHKLSSATLDKGRLIRFSARDVRCEMHASTSLPKYMSLSSPPWEMITASTFKTLSGATAVVAEYRCRMDPAFAYESVLPRITSHYEGWNGREFQASPIPGAGEFAADSVSVRPDESTVFVKSGLAFDATHRFGYYEVRATPQPGRLRKDITNLSTDSDADTTDFDKTYRFSWLVDQLGRSQLERTLSWSPFALTVQYR